MKVLVVVGQTTRRLELEVPDVATTTVGDVKRLLWQLEGVPPPFQRLECTAGGAKLRLADKQHKLKEDARTLESYGIESSSVGVTLRMHVKLCQDRKTRTLPAAVLPTTMATTPPSSSSLPPSSSSSSSSSSIPSSSPASPLPATASTTDVDRSSSSSSDGALDLATTVPQPLVIEGGEEAEEQEITVTVRRWASLQFDVRMRPSDTVLKIKQQVCQWCGAQPGDQRLMFRSVELQDERTLRSYDITDNTVLTLW